VTKEYRELHRRINQHSDKVLHGGWALCPCAEAQGIREMFDKLRALDAEEGTK
jgi:hypothetical protein